MMLHMQALSVVRPWGEAIATGRKTIEVRSWSPETWPIERLLIVENGRRLTREGDEDADGRARAVVRVVDVRPWTQADAAAACSTYEPGWLAWVLADVQPIAKPFRVVAARKLYWVDVEEEALRWR